MTLLTVILSAYIRLAEVGVGCDPWPDCYARLDPAMEKRGVAVLTQEGRGMAHYGARVAHRYIASVLGLFILGIFIQALRQGAGRATALWVPVAVLGITIFLSLLGYYTPSRSNPLITMGNLLGGMGLLALLWWLMQREAGNEAGRDGAAGLRPVAVAALVLVLAQIVLGGWGSANYASSNCPGLVSCQGEILTNANVADAFNPLRHIEMDGTGKVLPVDSLGLISMSHRIFALVTAAYLAWLVRRFRHRQALKSTLLALSVCSIGQIAVGVSAIWLEMPLLLVTLHNTLAAGLLVGSVNLLHRAVPATVSPPPP